MKKIISLLLFAAMTSGAAIATEASSFAGPRAASSGAHRISREHAKAEKSANGVGQAQSGEKSGEKSGAKSVGKSGSKSRTKSHKGSRATSVRRAKTKRGAKAHGVRKIRHRKMKHRRRAAAPAPTV